MPVRIILGIGVTLVGFGIAAFRFHWLSKLIRSGKKDPNRSRGSIVPKAEAEATEVAGQRKLLQWTVPGLAHFFTMWGFTILLLTIIEAYGALFQKTFHIPIIGTWNWVGAIEDFFACAVLVALIVFSVIRIKNAPQRLERKSRFYGSHTGAAWLVLAMIAGVMITLLLYRAAQINAIVDSKTGQNQFPYGTSWGPFASHALANVLAPLGSGVNSVLATVFLILNVAIISGFIVFVSYSKHLHIFIAPINVAFSRRPRALGALDSTPDMDMENVDEDTVFGVGEVGHFTWKQMLDFATCTECGRCQSACPAWNTEKPLSPKLLIMNLRDNMFASATPLLTGEGEQTALVPNVIDPDVLWSCTTCGACVEECPVDIEHIDAIVDMRRYQVLMDSEFPSRPGSCCATSRTRAIPGASARTSAPSGPRPSISRFPSSPAPSPTTSSTSTGWAAPAPSTSGRARACRPPPACCTVPVSPSPSSAPRSPAPETRSGAWATSTSTKSRPR